MKARRRNEACLAPEGRNVTAIVRAHAEPIEKENKPARAPIDPKALATRERAREKREAKAAHIRSLPIEDIRSPKERAREIIRRHYRGIPPFTFTIDFETTTDTAQRLRFGFAAVHGLRSDEIVGGYAEGILTRDAFATLVEVYCVHDFLTCEELCTLTAWCNEHSITLVSRIRFENIFKKWVIDYQATLLGFNLFFDLSRMATAWKPAGSKFAGGFTLTWCHCHQRTGSKIQPGECYYHSAIRARKVGPKKMLYAFRAVPPAFKGMPGIPKRVVANFCDVSTFAAAVGQAGGSLASCCAQLKVDAAHAKKDAPPHGETLSLAS